jgi:hypothetical protein
MVNPVNGVGGVEDRLVSGDNDMVMVLTGSVKKGPPSCKDVIGKVSRSWLNQQETTRRVVETPKKKHQTHTLNPPTHDTLLGTESRLNR